LWICAKFSIHILIQKRYATLCYAMLSGKNLNLSFKIGFLGYGQAIAPSISFWDSTG
jgi:hypothetical protein